MIHKVIWFLFCFAIWFETEFPMFFSVSSWWPTIHGTNRVCRGLGSRIRTWNCCVLVILLHQTFLWFALTLSYSIDIILNHLVPFLQVFVNLVQNGSSRLLDSLRKFHDIQLPELLNIQPPELRGIRPPERPDILAAWTTRYTFITSILGYISCTHLASVSIFMSHLAKSNKFFFKIVFPVKAQSKIYFSCRVSGFCQ